VVTRTFCRVVARLRVLCLLHFFSDQSPFHGGARVAQSCCDDDDHPEGAAAAVASLEPGEVDGDRPTLRAAGGDRVLRQARDVREQGVRLRQIDAALARVAAAAVEVHQSVA